LTTRERAEQQHYRDVILTAVGKITNSFYELLSIEQREDSLHQ